MFAMIFGFLFILYVVAALIGIAGAVIEAVFSGFASVIPAVLSGRGILIGIVLGFLLVRAHMKKAAQAEEE